MRVSYVRRTSKGFFYCMNIDSFILDDGRFFKIKYPKYFLFVFLGIDYYDENFINSGVYMLGGRYVGRSNDIKTRVKRHIIEAINLRHYNENLQNLILNHILENKPLKFEVLSNLNTHQEEQNFINKFDDLFNKDTIF